MFHDDEDDEDDDDKSSYLVNFDDLPSADLRTVIVTHLIT